MVDLKDMVDVSMLAIEQLESCRARTDSKSVVGVKGNDSGRARRQRNACDWYGFTTAERRPA